MKIPYGALAFPHPALVENYASIIASIPIPAVGDLGAWAGIYLQWLSIRSTGVSTPKFWQP